MSKLSLIMNIPIQNIKVKIIFTDKDKNIIENVNTSFSLKNNILNKNDLIDLIKFYKVFKNNNYKLHSILKYNIDLNLENIKFFIKYPTNFLRCIDKIDDIKWVNTCKYLEELNTLFIIFIQKNKSIKSNKKTLKLIKDKYSKKNKKTKKAKNMKI